MDAVTTESPPQPSQPSSRAPKQDRSRATRRRLLEAAVSCLAEHGWAGSTVSVVAERAGVSRGAAQHHFPTREDLFTAAVEYVAEERSTALRALFPEGAADRRAVVAALVDLYTGPLFRAALHLWVAASDEEQLRPRVTELEARVGRETHRVAVDLLGADESRPGVRETVQGLLDMARGLGLANLLTDDGVRRDRVVAQWASLLDESLDRPPKP
ncbi:TetR/AcrR family transcriptional regulator [Streptomyces graminilatus]|uniref:TetR/AcrR family transcriptional regulator n=1 Tax=Streptomyces graminilatus TaxID=1464070 RepID=UPI0006E14EDF|nr:TetR/AcrR family transcriptional regulator [Streptomyces graminilatus]